MSSASSALSRGSGTSTVDLLAGAHDVRALGGAAPPTRTAPSAMSFWMRERERSEQAAARKRSSRVPDGGGSDLERRSIGRR